MIKMKTSTASDVRYFCCDICMLFCALIVCTVVPTVRTTGTSNTTTVITSIPEFEENDEYFDWHSTDPVSSTTTSEDEKYGSTTTVSTPTVTTVLTDQLYSVTDDAINSSTIPENDDHLPDKEYGSTKPIPTINVNQSFEEPPKRTDPLITTTIANEMYDSTTTPGPGTSGMDLNDTMVADDAGGRTTDNVIGDSPKPTNKEYKSTEPTPTKDYTQTKLGESSTRTDPLITTTIANEMYDSTTTPGPGTSGMDLNDTMVADDAGGRTTDNVIGDSPKPTNKEYKSTEPTPTKDYTQTKLGESSTRTQLPSTTIIAIKKNGPTTTSKPSKDVIDNSPNKQKPKNGFNLSHKKHRSTEPSPKKSKIHDDDITVVTMRSKPKKFPFLDPISSILANNVLVQPPTRPAKWIKPTNKNCTCVYDKQHSKLCKNNEEETTTTKILGQFEKFNQLEQQRQMMETTTNDFDEKSEKSKKSKEWELKQKIWEMESNRFKSILDLFNRHK